MLAGEEICHNLTEWLKALLSDRKETGKWKFLAIWQTATSWI
jgi:hypothetical protein